jgi:hypothetical protein
MPDDVARCIRCGFVSAPKIASTTPPAKQGRIRNGWALASQSWRVLMLDKGLVIFPLLSGLACLLLLASFVGGAWANGLLERDQAIGEGTSWLLLFAYYFANYFVIVFFNSALVACAMMRFHGATPTVGDGLRAARERLSQIIAWALLAASIGVLLRMIEERVGFIGKIVVALLGAAWTVATYFVVPVLVVEKLGPLDAFKRSAGILKKAWGESVVSNLSISLVTFLAALLIVVPTGVVFLVLAVKMASLAVALAGLGVVLLILLAAALIGSTLNSIALCALYLYATEGKVPQAFGSAGIEHAFAAHA